MSLDSFTVNWNFPTAMRFGIGRIRELADACRSLGMTRPLLVTDPGLAGLDIVKQAIAGNTAAGLPTGLFADVAGNPVEANVAAGLSAYRDGGHDGIIAFGGGSAMDVGKIVALMAGQTRPLFDFVDVGDNWTRVNAAGVAPIVAVPTTAGTGSEVGRSGVVTEAATQQKRVIFHPKMQPAIVISDPALSAGLPANLTAWVGMDALSHCLEAYCCTMYHPMADGIALEGIRLVARWLPEAVADGGNLEARAHMLVAASMGATAFQKGLGSMHAMSHPCSARRGTHHGLTNAVVMPYVLAFNRPEIEDKLPLLARLLDLPGSGFDAVLGWVLRLREKIAIPHTLAEIGIAAGDLDMLAADAEADPLTGLNPRKADRSDYAALFRQAMDGRIS